jgi:hypothetical protein
MFGFVCSRLYVRRAGSSSWRELRHYHDIVKSDGS